MQGADVCCTTAAGGSRPCSHYSTSCTVRCACDSLVISMHTGQKMHRGASVTHTSAHRTAVLKRNAFVSLPVRIGRVAMTE